MRCVKGPGAAAAAVTAVAQLQSVAQELPYAANVAIKQNVHKEMCFVKDMQHNRPLPFFRVLSLILGSTP